MRYYTHILFSILIALALNLKGIFFYSFLILFTLLPDIDNTKSILGRKTRIFSILGHRTITHSLLFLIGGFLLIFLFSQQLSFSFLIGVGSHLVLDALTKKGIRPFYPLPFKVKGFLKTGGIGEHMLFLIGIIIIFLHWT